MSAKFREEWFPWLLSVVGLVAYFFILSDSPMPKTFDAVLNAVISVSSIAFGFLTASLAILLSLQTSRVIRQLRASGKYELVVNYHVVAIRWSLALTITSVLGLFIDYQEPPTAIWFWWVRGVWIFLVLISFTLCVRVVELLGRILLSVSSEPK